MFQILQKITGLTPAIQGFLLLVSCLLAPNVLANPTPITTLSSNPNLTDNPEKERETKIDNACGTFTPFTVNQSEIDPKNPENTNFPTSFCASDLITPTDIIPENSPQSPSNPNLENFLPQFQAEATPENNAPQTLPEASPSSKETTQNTEENDQWHFKFQPYATIPINTYGTVTARGRTVNYSLGLGQLLQYLTVAGSARIEAWNGSWGFIVDGYFASLKGIGNFQPSRIRTANTLDTLSFLVNQGVNGKAEEFLNNIDRDIQALKTIQELRNEQVVQTLEQRVQTIKSTVTESAQKLRELALKIQDVQDNIVNKKENVQSAILNLPTLSELDLDRQEAKTILIKKIAEIKNDLDREKIEDRIEGKIQDLRDLRQRLSEIRDTLEQVSQKVKELRAKVDTEALRELAAKIDNTKSQLAQKIETIQKAQEFIDNREPQQLDLDSTTAISFDQGIYDFAVSYHFGAPPAYGLPDKPSNRAFPLLWFEPIAGVRLNNISISIDQTVDFQLSSSLVNFKGTFQENFGQQRTWFEPMLGGKLGLQISDPITFWLRGDASGFGLAGETDLSWNAILGMDWWVRQNISLQLAYRFYSIDYKNGSGDNAFGFTQSFNGPYISATFNF